MEVNVREEFKKNWLICIVGVVIYFVSHYVLITNERKSMKHTHSLSKAYEDVIALNQYEPIRPELEGHLVHISGGLSINEPLTEPEYGVSIQSVKLKRRVQMYQWIEETNVRYTSTDSTETDYYYITEWRDKLVDSRSFYIRHSHENPSEKPLQTYVYVSPFVKLGQFHVGTALKQKFDSYVEFTSDQRPDRKDVKLHMGIYYHCEDIWNPKVGDIRVQFYYSGLNWDQVTVIAMQKNGILVPYPIKDQEIALLRYGELTISQMFNAEHADVRYETWKYRLFGWFLTYASFVLLSNMACTIILNTQLAPLLRNNSLNESILTRRITLSISSAMISASSTWFMLYPHLTIAVVTAALTPAIYILFLILNDQNGENRRLL